MSKMRLYQQSTMPWRNLLLAVLLCLHVGCILVEAFAANLPSHAADPHHSFGLVTHAEKAPSERGLPSHADNTGQLSLTEHANQMAITVSYQAHLTVIFIAHPLPNLLLNFSFNQ